MNKVLLFAGTTEGRTLTQYLSQHHVMTHVCVATQYGEMLLPEDSHVAIHTGRQTKEAMIELMAHVVPDLVIDATHPYAEIVSENITSACESTGTTYIRLLRASNQSNPNTAIYVNTIEEAVNYLNKTTGNVLLTTGSKDLELFTSVKDFDKRLFARVLFTPQVVASCMEMGYQASHLMGMQGPFSEGMNYEMMKQLDAKYLVTKESGVKGGFQEKMDAAFRANVTPIVIGRPKDEVGLTYESCIGLLNERFKLNFKPQITLLGIGMGNLNTMTTKGLEACKEADLIIGGKRMLDSLACFETDVHDCFKTCEIKSYIQANPQYQKIVIALSGDTGFYSGADQLMTTLSDYNVEVIPGISSGVYLSARLGKPWQKVRFISQHGKKENLIANVLRHEDVVVILGGVEGASKVCQALDYYGLKDVQVYIGEQLSYDDEKITHGQPKDFLSYQGKPLSVIWIENSNATKCVVTHGIGDDHFVRGKVPMTKEEVRCITVSKMRLNKKAVIYDIGAGTGSISIEMALQSYEGHVYAIEKNPEGVALLEANKRAFKTEHITVIEGTAPDAMTGLPIPSHAFIGGSSGNMKVILQMLLKKNPRIRVVINAITLETVTEATDCMKTLPFEQVDVAQVNIAKSHVIGKYHMMKGENPVYIISATGSG